MLHSDFLNVMIKNVLHSNHWNLECAASIYVPIVNLHTCNVHKNCIFSKRLK